MRIIGVVLAGGKSSRMGSNKALLALKGDRLVDRAQSVLRDSLGHSDVLVSGAVDGVIDPVIDEIPGLGPLSGVLSVINQLSSRGLADVSALLIIPVDMPLLDVEILKKLTANVSGADLVKYKGFELPVLLKINDEVKRVVASVVDDPVASKRSFKELTRRLRFCELESACSDDPQFTNINEPTEWRQLSHER